MYNIASFLKIAPPVPEFYFLRVGLLTLSRRISGKPCGGHFPMPFRSSRARIIFSWQTGVPVSIVRRIFRFGNVHAVFRGIVIRPYWQEVLILNVFGLTGGPGCGKSTVSRFFCETGKWHVVDADAVCHELYEKVPADLVRDLRENFGTAVVTSCGAVDRKALGACVFAAPEQLRKLNQLVHPFIFREVQLRLDRIASSPGEEVPGVLLDAPLLFETGMESLTPGGVIAVWTDPATQRDRLLSRGWSEAELSARIEGQLSSSEKLSRADYGLISRGDFSFLYDQCRTLMQNLTSKN